MKKLFGMLGLLSLILGTTNAQNLVNGGGFESPIVPTGQPYLLSVTPTGWSGTGDLVVQGYFGSVHSGDGNQWFDLNPDISAGTGISQTISLVGGTSYAFSFIYNGGGGGSTTQISFSLTSLAGTLLSGAVSTASLNVYGGSPWATYQATFSAPTSGAATLSFVPNGSLSGGFIDAVSISSVPEPGTVPMMIVATLAFALWRVRHRRRARSTV